MSRNYVPMDRAMWGQAKAYKPPRSMRPSGKTVPCPLCAAAVGEPCTNTVTNEPLSRTHDRRLRMATRAQNARREAER